VLEAEVEVQWRGSSSDSQRILDFGWMRYGTYVLSSAALRATAAVCPSSTRNSSHSHRYSVPFRNVLRGAGLLRAVAWGVFARAMAIRTVRC
jgi:hypothetical protein